MTKQTDGSYLDWPLSRIRRCAPSEAPTAIGSKRTGMRFVAGLVSSDLPTVLAPLVPRFKYLTSDF